MTEELKQYETRAPDIPANINCPRCGIWLVDVGDPDAPTKMVLCRVCAGQTTGIRDGGN